MTRAIAALLVAALSLARPAPADAYLKFGFRVGATTVDVQDDSGATIATREAFVRADFISGVNLVPGP